MASQLRGSGVFKLDTFNPGAAVDKQINHQGSIGVFPVDCAMKQITVA